MLACLLVIGAALLLESTEKRGVLAVSPLAWFLIIIGLGVWLCCLTMWSGAQEQRPRSGLTGPGSGALKAPHRQQE